MYTKELSRELRKQQTDAEKIIWDRIRNRLLCGKKFTRQHPIKFIINNQQRFFIADFYCAEYKFIIEADGKIHDNQKEYDQLRDWIIHELGYKVLRFTNEEILSETEKVLEKIKEEFLLIF